MKACRVAQDEIKQGHVKFVLPEELVEPVLDLPFALNTRSLSSHRL